MFSFNKARQLANCRNYASRLLQQARRNYASRRWETLQQEIMQENMQKLLAIMPEAEILETLPNFPLEKQETAFCLYSPNGMPAQVTEQKVQNGGKLPAYCYAARVLWDNTEWDACLDFYGRLWLQAQPEALLARMFKHRDTLEKELVAENYATSVETIAEEWNNFLEWPICHTYSLSGHWISPWAVEKPALFVYVAYLENRQTQGANLCAALDTNGNLWTREVLL